MWRYIKSAYLVGVDVPALGRLPINVLLTAGFVILGVAQPAFWLIGLALEAAIVTVLAFNPRFQKYVQSQQQMVVNDDDEARRRQLIQVLEPEARNRLAALGVKCNQIIDVYRTQQAEDYILDTNREALARLQWNYVKLLVARHQQLTMQNGESEESLRAKINDLGLSLQNESQPESLRESKSATMAILKKRLANIQRRDEILQEIDSDCARIEAQVDLILENATMQSRPQAISSDIELASDLLGGNIFGEDEPAVTHLDRKFAAAKPQQGAS